MLLKKATDFINEMYKEVGIEDSKKAERIEIITEEINRTGTYTHTTEELTYGAKVAWRNSNRCVGRLFWDKLEVRDLRYITGEDEFVTSIEQHIDDATNDGKIIPLISIYSNDIKIHNEQLLRYAGYEDAGDPKSKEATKLANHVGWTKEPDDFNILPLIYEMNGQGLKYYEYPSSIVKVVNITHNDYPKLEKLGLRWYVVPIISNMDLEIGGLYYHTTPFNGWYMETEIGVRNFTDEYRYNKLRDIAEAFDFDTSSTTTYWRDRALVEFNYAVFHSFKRNGVSIVDHITASKQFKQFEKKEEKAGRDVTGKWSWLVPPMSPSLTHNYHKGFDDTVKSPNLLYRKEVKGCPFSG